MRERPIVRFARAETKSIIRIKKRLKIEESAPVLRCGFKKAHDFSHGMN
jgi:hypothetical protein